MSRVQSLLAAIALAGASAGAARADDAQDHPLARIKQHEQELEKKIEVERDRPDKKAHAKKVVDHAEDNIRGLGQQIKGAGHEVSAAAKHDGREDAGRDAKSQTPSPAPRGKRKEKPAQNIGPKATEKKSETSAAAKKVPEKSPAVEAAHP